MDEDDLNYIRARCLVGKDHERYRLWQKEIDMAKKPSFMKAKVYITMPDGSKKELVLHDNVEYGFPEEKPQKPVKIKALCNYCPNELSETMDAYYGLDQRGKGACAPCRRKLGIR